MNIVYKQTVLPTLMTVHTGRWLLAEDAEGVTGVFPLFWTPDQAANWLSCLYPSSYSPGVKYPSAECLRTRL